MLILPLNEDLPIRAPLVKGCVASGCCSQKREKHRAPDGPQSSLGTVEVPLHCMWPLCHSPFEGAFPSWEPRAAPTLTSTSLQLDGGFAHGDTVLHLLSQAFRVCDLT